MKVNCLIIDDEPLAINVIKNHIELIENFELINTFSNSIEGLNFLKNNAIDVVFLDINMPVLDGINFIKSLENPPLLVITSAYDQFAIETYELDVLDYLVKPIEFPRLMKAVNKINKRLSNTNKVPLETNKENPFIFVKIDKKRMKKIFLNEILVIESLKDYLKINTLTGKYIIHSTLSDFTSLLPEKDFLRIHRSYTIAIDKIDAVEGNSIEIEGLRYVIGRSYIDEVKQRILNASI
ncbi:MAG TPA: response regulator transcription factor [Flavobacterium sp.]|uniref:DNA-binding response regulator n=1 Tax=Flavobacterium flevense TaxID=983 RepID=A0A4Y4B0S6_9FLAO|nr:response regulator transcription factor [Flavobacterium flevense]GEC72982.1 DNA-binding response regulator [Flavobacterium flevense]SHM12524.1 two component transcriptional regulator, LytTR family [Flavobacterium flevense]HJR99790.1 response regulator transcription factor [Flavobacterium sp.]